MRPRHEILRLTVGDALRECRPHRGVLVPLRPLGVLWLESQPFDELSIELRFYRTDGEVTPVRGGIDVVEVRSPVKHVGGAVI